MCRHCDSSLHKVNNILLENSSEGNNRSIGIQVQLNLHQELRKELSKECNNILSTVQVRIIVNIILEQKV